MLFLPWVVKHIHGVTCDYSPTMMQSHISCTSSFAVRPQPFCSKGFARDSVSHGHGHGSCNSFKWLNSTWKVLDDNLQIFAPHFKQTQPQHYRLWSYV